MDDRDELLEWLVLIRAPGLGAVGTRRLLDQFEGPGAILGASANQLKQAGVAQAVRHHLAHPDWPQARTDREWMIDNHCRLIAVTDTAYPPLLKDIHDPPVALFAMGDVELLAVPQLAVVGSRSATAGGLDTAFEFARYLAARGLGITSGLAQGIDAQAHRGALAAQGITVAVTGTGPDRIYPAEHRQLAHAIVADGVVVTKLPPGTRPDKSTFPRRNRIISGLALGTLVVEAAKGSGSLITARLAAEQGREVFAIPGSIHNPMARGCHRLIRQGAKLVETADDILEELGPLLTGRVAVPPMADAQASGAADLPPGQQQILTLMGWDPVTVDQLVERGGLTPGTVSSMLLGLELSGHVVAQAAGTYTRLR